jgi:hypothetical protein
VRRIRREEQEAKKGIGKFLQNLGNAPPQGNPRKYPGVPWGKWPSNPLKLSVQVTNQQKHVCVI